MLMEWPWWNINNIWPQRKFYLAFSKVQIETHAIKKCFLQENCDSWQYFAIHRIADLCSNENFEYNNCLSTYQCLFEGKKREEKSLVSVLYHENEEHPFGQFIFKIMCINSCLAFIHSHSQFTFPYISIRLHTMLRATTIRHPTIQKLCLPFANKNKWLDKCIEIFFKFSQENISWDYFVLFVLLFIADRNPFNWLWIYLLFSSH